MCSVVTKPKGEISVREREPDSIQTVYLFCVNVVCFYFKPRSEYVIEVDRTFRLKIAAIFSCF